LKSFSVTLPFPLTDSTATQYPLSIAKSAATLFQSPAVLPFLAARRARIANPLSN
jgi:hypothetical protein